MSVAADGKVKRAFEVLRVDGDVGVVQVLIRPSGFR